MRIAIFSNQIDNVTIMREALKNALKAMRNSVVESIFQDGGLDFVFNGDYDEKSFFKSKIDITIIFEDCILAPQALDKIREKNENCFIIACGSSDFLGLLGDMFFSKIDDFVELPLPSAETLRLNARTWLELGALRQEDTRILKEGKNSVGVKVWERRTRFDLIDESSLGLLWEFFLNDKRFDALPYSSNWIQACYSVSLRLLELGYKPSVIFTENDDSYFLTITSLPSGDRAFYGELVKYAQLEKLRFIGHTHAKSKGIFSLHLLKSLSFNEKPQESLKQKAKERENSSYVPLKNPSMSLDNAKEYVRECGIDEEDLAELRMIEEEFRGAIDSTTEALEWLKIYGKYFVGFSEAIKRLLEFEDLQKIVADIGEIMLNVKDTDNIDGALFFADLVRQDLSLWFSHVFVLQDAQNIHYLDASLASSCYKIKGYLSPQTTDATEDDGDDLELF